MARAWGLDSIWVFLHGVVSSGILPPSPPPPILQPFNEKKLGYPEIIGFYAKSTDVQAYQSLQIAAFHGENPDLNDFENLQVVAFHAEKPDSFDEGEPDIAAFHGEQLAQVDDLQIEAFQVTSDEPPGPPNKDDDDDRWDGD